MSGLVTAPVTPDEAGKATTQDTQTQSQTQEIEAAVKTSEAGQITITSRGHDVREVLFDLFEQGSKSFVLEPGNTYTLFSCGNAGTEGSAAFTLDMVLH